MSIRSKDAVITLILAGGHGERLGALSATRAIAAVPFAGKYRIIDFVLSNCSNSGLTDVMVLTQYRPISLHAHIGNGKPWDLDRLRGGVRVVSPYTGRPDSGWDRGTADAVYQNISELTESPAGTVVVLYGDHVYKMDYRPMLAQHRQTNADVTVGVMQMPLAEAHRFGVVSTDANGRITDFQEKPDHPASDRVSMGIYVFDKERMIERLQADAATLTSQHDFGRNILPGMIAAGDKVFAYEFTDYWRDVGTVQSYWNASMELLDPQTELKLFDRGWVIYTRSEERPPALIGKHANLDRSLVSHGCQIHGEVIRSVLAPGVIIEEGAVVRDSVIMTDTIIRRDSVVDRVVADKEIVIGAGSHIGSGEIESGTHGITLIGKRAILPEGMTVGRNCSIAPGVIPGDFPSNEIASGETIDAAPIAARR